jgi:hypothetical protein
MIKVKFAAVVTAAVTAVSIGSAQARPLPQKMAGVAISTSQIKSNAPLPPLNSFRVANAATIQLAAGRPRALSEPTPPAFVPPASPPAATARPFTWRPTQPNLAPPGSFPGRVSRRGSDPLPR